MLGQRPRLLATLPIVVAVLLACGGDPATVDDTPTDEEPVDAEAAPLDEEPSDEDALPEDEDGDGAAAAGGSASSDSRELTIATVDAADRTGVPRDDITLVELAMVTWPDGALGCPEPGTMYTQALVDGYRIVLEADGTTLVYHGEIGADPFLCEAPQEPVDPTR